jgi:hypothetical protein
VSAADGGTMCAVCANRALAVKSWLVTSQGFTVKAPRGARENAGGVSGERL